MENNENDLEYPSEATLGDQWHRGSTAEWQSLLADSALSAAPVRDRVSQLAYQLYLHRGQVHGYDLDDWFTAERIILLQLAQTKKLTGDRSHGKKER